MYGIRRIYRIFLFFVVALSYDYFESFLWTASIDLNGLPSYDFLVSRQVTLLYHQVYLVWLFCFLMKFFNL